MDSKTKILTLDHADTIRNFVKYNDSIIKKDLTKYIDDNINNEATARQNADNVLDVKIDTKISEEETARKNQCETLQRNIDSEEEARQNADNALNLKIVDEATARQNADNALDAKIVDEEEARQTADNALDNRTKTLESSVNTLNGKVNDLEESYDNLTGEIGDINTQLKDELLIEINNKITTAKGEVSEEYNTKVNTLTEELNALIAESSEANKDKIDEIQLELDTLEADTNNALSALDGLRRELQTGEIFSEGQLDEIIRTVMIKDVTIGEDTIEAPTIFSSNIVSLIAKFGQINAANIIAGDISGHTVKSNSTVDDENSDFNGKPTWELQNEGSGHLANGNIYWDNDGNVTFGEDVKLSWNNIKDAVNGNIVIPDISEGYTEEQIKTFATEITNNTVTTGFVNALGITAKELSVEGMKALTIDAEQINAENLVVTKLNTKQSTENTENLVSDQVRIQDNVITVTGGENNKPVLRVTGEKLNEEFNFSSDYLRPASSSITFTKPNNPINILLTNSLELTKEYNIEVGSISLNLPHEDIDNITSKIRLYSETGVPCTVEITSVTGDTTNAGSLNIGFRCCVEKDNETIVEYKYNALDLMINNGKFDNYDGTSSTSKRIYVPFDTICEKKYYGGEYTKKIYLVINKGSILGADKINVNVDFWGSDKSNIRIPYYKKHLITEMPNMNIAKDGIRYFVDDYNYFNIDDDGYFTYYGPGKQYGFGVDMNGAWIVIGGKKFNVSNLNEQLKTAANSAIANNVNIKELQTEIKGEDGNGGLKHKFNELNTFVKDETDGLVAQVNNLDNDLKSTSAEVSGLSGEVSGLSSNFEVFKTDAVTQSKLETELSNYTKIISDDDIKSFIKNLNIDITCYVHSAGDAPRLLTVEKKDTGSIIQQPNYYETGDSCNITMSINNLIDNNYSPITIFPIENDNYIIRPVIGSIYSYNTGDAYNQKYVNVIEITSDKFNDYYEVNCEIINKTIGTSVFKPIKFKIVDTNTI